MDLTWATNEGTVLVTKCRCWCEVKLHQKCDRYGNVDKCSMLVGQRDGDSSQLTRTTISVMDWWYLPLFNANGWNRLSVRCLPWRWTKYGRWRPWLLTMNGQIYRLMPTRRSKQTDVNHGFWTRMWSRCGKNYTCGNPSGMEENFTALQRGA